MQFQKYSSTGNDFIFFDNRDDALTLGPKTVQSLCHRRFGIGADGVVLLNSSNKSDLAMHIYNSDGSVAQMCGNALRAITHFAHYHLKLKDQPSYTIETMSGEYKTYIDGQIVKVQMTQLSHLDEIDVSNLSYSKAIFMDTGVPHCVLLVDSLEDVNVQAMGQKIRYDKRFPEGTNVTFMEIMNDYHIKVRFYERGVEGETLCCGTGVMAATVACNQFFGWSSRLNVQTMGGQVEASVDEKLKELYFGGSVVNTFSGTVDVPKNR